MANTNLMDELYQRMSAEQEQYRKWLLGQPPDDILNHAAEYIVHKQVSAVPEQECAVVIEISSLWNQHTEMELDTVCFWACYDGTDYLKKARIL